MRIAYCSDLHLDVGPNPINPEFFDLEADVLILAGDIVEAKNAKHYHDFWSKCADTWDQVIYICGNHEYYGGAIPKSEIKLYEELKKYGFTFLQNEFVEINGIRFIGSTLWTDMNRSDPMTELAVGAFMNDFKGSIRLSNNGYRKFLPRDSAKLHRTSTEYIRKQLNTDKECVVITHHAPSHLSVAKRYAHLRLENGGYVSDLSDMMLDYPNLKFWIHGHVHDKFDYQIGDCRVLCNPRGYGGERPEHLKPYQPEVFEV